MTVIYSTSNVNQEMLLKMKDLIKLVNVNLNHFPNYEKYGICQEIRKTMYEVFELTVEADKKRTKATSLDKLDYTHEKLRQLINISYELDYFKYHKNKNLRTDSESKRRYTAVSIKINELGAMIGGWINANKK